MRTKTIITCLIIAAATVFSQGIQFTEGTWQSVKDKAAAENKLIMVDAFADWCVPCKMMAKDVFTKPEVGEYYNSTFINYQIDAEKGEGVDFAKEYQIEFYPTILYIDGTGKVVEKKIGAMSPELFLAAGKNVANPETRFSTLEEKYKAGDRNPELVRKYMRALVTSMLPYEDVMNEYFKTQPQEEWANSENAALIIDLVSDPKSDMFKYMVSNRDKFAAVKSEKAVNDKIFYVYGYDIFQNASMWSEKDLENYFKGIESLGLKLPDQFRYRSYVDFYQAKGDWKKFVKYADEYINKYFDYSDKQAASGSLNSYAWTVYENLSDEKSLEKASKWTKKSIELDKTYYNLDTYAAIQFKLGDLDEAEKYCKLAIKKGKEDNLDVTPTEEMLKQIQKGPRI